MNNKHNKQFNIVTLTTFIFCFGVLLNGVKKSIIELIINEPCHLNLFWSIVLNRHNRFIFLFMTMKKVNVLCGMHKKIKEPLMD